MIVSYYDYYNNYNGYTISQFEFEHNGVKILEIKRPSMYDSVYKNKEILDNVEKKYLAGVIEPFKSRINYIVKFNSYVGKKEFICIYLKNAEDIDFPYFEKGKMYEGMKTGKKYTLEELGL